MPFALMRPKHNLRRRQTSSEGNACRLGLTVKAGRQKKTQFPSSEQRLPWNMSPSSVLVTSTPSQALPCRGDSSSVARSSVRSINPGRRTEVMTTAGSRFSKAISPLTKAKSTRARTGCFTCRDRHIKCDEMIPSCLNCQRSKRSCVRGVRLNFQAPMVHAVPDRHVESGRYCTLDKADTGALFTLTSLSSRHFRRVSGYCQRLPRWIEPLQGRARLLAAGPLPELARNPLEN